MDYALSEALRPLPIHPPRGQPGRKEAHQAIAEAADAAGLACDAKTARELFWLIERAVDYINHEGGRSYPLRPSDRRLKLLIDAVMPVGAEPEPGSAHELLSKLFTTGRRGVRLKQVKYNSRTGFAIALVSGSRR